MSKLSITEASEKIGISPTQCRYWSKLLEIEITKEGRVSFIPSGSENLLLAMKQAVEGGQSPSVASVEIKATFAAPPMIQEQINQNNNLDFLNKITELEKAVMFLAENNKKLFEQNKCLVEIVQDQSRKLDNLSAKLLPPPQSKPVQVWQPAPKKAVNFSWLKRAWYEVTAPEKLRAMP
jgi:hypothetical protein